MVRIARTAGALGLGLAILAVAGCGGSSGPKYTLASVQKCLDGEGLKTTRDHNTILAGSQGNLMVNFGYGLPFVFIVFAKSSGEAKKIADQAVAAAEQSAHLDEKTIRDGVQQTENVFIYSDTGPLTETAKTKIAACLK
jgi:hypothetical protein